MSFSGFMNMELAIYNSGGYNKYGKKNFSAPTYTFGRFRQTNDTIVNTQKEVEPIHGVVHLKATENISIGDKIVYNSVSYRVLTKLHSVDGNGKAHHLELKVQEWSQA